MIAAFVPDSRWIAANITPRNMVSSMKPTARPLRSRLKTILASLPARGGGGLGPVQQPEPRHDRHDGRHADHAESHALEHLPDEQRAWQRVADTLFVGQPHAACDQDEADDQRQHPDAFTHAVKLDIEVRVQQQPRRVGENRDRGQRRQHQPEEQNECAHQQGLLITVQSRRLLGYRKRLSTTDNGIVINNHGRYESCKNNGHVKYFRLSYREWIQPRVRNWRPGRCCSGRMYCARCSPALRRSSRFPHGRSGGRNYRKMLACRGRPMRSARW